MLDQPSRRPTLHINLLGHFRLLYGDVPVSALEMPRLQSLLAYLLLYRDSPQPRNSVAFLLWPDTTDAQAQTNLRQLIHRLRRALPDADIFLKITGQTIQWNSSSPFTLDVMQLEHLLTDAARITSSDEGNEGNNVEVAALQRAINEYGGDLLPGCYDEWILPERERLRRLYAERLERLVRLLEDRQEYKAATGYAQRLLQHDPLHEAVYRKLMALYATQGDYAGAIRVYQSCVEVLNRELGAEPNPATQELYGRLITDAKLPQTTGESHETTRHIQLGQRPYPTNLPASPNPFVGREGEIAALRTLVSRPGVRLLTLTGPPGIGKTRLALHVAGQMADNPPESLADGVFYAPLAMTSDPALVAQAIAQAVGVREVEGKSLHDSLRDWLRNKRMLLLLDNFEQVLSAADLVAEIISSCPQVKIIVTSREALHIYGEYEFPVPPLELPDAADPKLATTEYLTQYAAVRLFTERAVSVQPHFTVTEKNAQAVTEICRRLDGLPLAIELAASRIRLLSPQVLLQRLENRLQALTGGARDLPPRQRTLRNAIEWSYSLLDPQEQAFFRRLGVFVGGCTLEAAEAICDDFGLADGSAEEFNPKSDVLASLVGKSLVQAGEGRDGEAYHRFRMLETLREYALERLEEYGELARIRQAHARYFLVLAEESAPHLTEAEQPEWLLRLGEDHDNLRAALGWALQRGEADVLCRLARALFFFWEARSLFSEGRQYLDHALRLMEASGRGPNTLWVDLLGNAGFLAFRQGDFGAALPLQMRGLEMARELGDEFRVVSALSNLGLVHWYMGDLATARALLEENLAISRTLGEKRPINTALSNLGLVALSQGHIQGAKRLFEEALGMIQTHGDRMGLVRSLLSLGLISWYEKRYAEGQAFVEKSMRLSLDISYMFGIALCLEGFALAAAAQEDGERAARLWGASEAVRETLGTPLLPFLVVVHNDSVTAVRARMGDATFKEAWAEGRTLTVAEAATYALREAG